MRDPVTAAWRCREKTSRGNVFWLRSEAYRASGEVGGTVRAFRCDHCGLWHIGGHHKRRGHATHAAFLRRVRCGGKEYPKYQEGGGV